MKSNSFKKSALILGIGLTCCLFGSEAKAYERYTWSDLVTGGNRRAAAEADDKLAVVCEWCGLKRIIRSQITDTAKLKNAFTVIHNRKKYSNDALFKAVMDVRYTYKYTYKDMKKADEVLSYLDSDPSLKIKADAERLLSSMDENSIRDDNFYNKLYTLRFQNNAFPYDNGYMPVITKERATLMLSIKEMIDGKGKQSEPIVVKCWKNIPSEILYLIATDRRENAYKLYINEKSSIDSKCQKLIDDFLYPLYMPVKPANRKFLAGVYAVEYFPNLGMDLINESLTSSPRVLKPEHALACLSDVYVRHNAYQEAQKVLKILSDYYPNSVWLK